MKISEIDLEYLKDYLGAEDEDEVRLKGHLASAKDIVMKANGYLTLEELDKNEYLSDVVLIYVQQLFDTGTIDMNKSFQGLLTMDRRF